METSASFGAGHLELPVGGRRRCARELCVVLVGGGGGGCCCCCCIEWRRNKTSCVYIIKFDDAKEEEEEEEAASSFQRNTHSTDNVKQLSRGATALALAQALHSDAPPPAAGRVMINWSPASVA